MKIHPHPQIKFPLYQPYKVKTQNCSYFKTKKRKKEGMGRDRRTEGKRDTGKERDILILVKNTFSLF